MFEQRDRPEDHEVANQQRPDGPHENALRCGAATFARKRAADVAKRKYKHPANTAASTIPPIQAHTAKVIVMSVVDARSRKCR